MKPLIPDDPKAPSVASILGPDQELWLLRVPGHAMLRTSLVEKIIDLSPGAGPNQVRGNYEFIDAGATDAAAAVVPVMAVEGADGVEYVCAGGFARQVNVNFVGAPMVRKGMEREPKRYPERPEDLGVMFRHAGVRKFAPVPREMRLGVTGGVEKDSGRKAVGKGLGEEAVERGGAKTTVAVTESEFTVTVEERSIPKSEKKAKKDKREKKEKKEKNDRKRKDLKVKSERI